MHGGGSRDSRAVREGGPVSVQQGGVQSPVPWGGVEEPAAGSCESWLLRPYVGAVCDVGMVFGFYAGCVSSVGTWRRKVCVAGDVRCDCLGACGGDSGGCR